MAETNWIVEVNEEIKNMVDTSTQRERWEKRSIYKIPECVTDLNEKAYNLQAVSFGPYHHGEDPLNLMEEHKRRSLLHFLNRSKKPLGLFIDSLKEVVQELKDSYDPLGHEWRENTNRFLQLMVVDGCFMLEILRTATYTLDDYATNDPIFSNHGKLHIMPYVKRDMLMLENQLPLLALHKLLAVESDKSRDEEFVNKLIVKFYFPGTRVSRMGKCLHVLDVYRTWMLKEAPQHKTRRPRSRSIDRDGGEEIIRSATELNEAGISFKKSKTQSLKDISFNGGVLRLPMVVVDDTTESSFLNDFMLEQEMK